MSDYARGGYIKPSEDDSAPPFLTWGCGYIITAEQARRIATPLLDALNKREECGE